jgi:proteasome alpha subunit
LDYLEEIDIFGISGTGYDTSTGIFSPDGRIFAAEYAKKAVEQGETAIGVLVDEGVILLARKKTMPLHEPESIEKISKIDDHVGVATSGFMADARRLIADARVKAQSYWLTFEEQVPAEALADYICDVKAQYTQGGGARPYGVAMIIGSVDYDGSPKLYVTDPVGTYWGFLAAVIGRGNVQAGEYLEKNYKKEMTLTDALPLALSALRQAADTELSPDSVEIAHVPVSTSKFHKYSRSEISEILSPA